MKIMLCSDLAFPYVGGNERYLMELGAGLVERGHEVHWLTSRIPHTKKHETYKGIRIHRIPIIFSKRYVFPGRQLFAFTAIPYALRMAKRMDILHFTTFVAGITGAVVKRLTDKPVVLTCHEMFGDVWKLIGRNEIEKTIYPKIERFIARAPFDAIIAPSYYSKDTLVAAGASPENIEVVPHGIDMTIFNPRKRSNLRKRLGLEKRKVVGYSGRLTLEYTGQSKNLLLLLNAMKLVSKELPDAVLMLGGAGFESLLPHIKTLGIEDRVVYAGKRPYEDVPDFMKACDVVVCPAITDGFCFVLAEASACGVPIIATDRGSHPERMLEGKTGLITELSPHSLANAIIKVLKDRSLAQKLGKAGAEFTKDFTWDKTVDAYTEIYERLSK